MCPVTKSSRFLTLAGCLLLTVLPGLGCSHSYRRDWVEPEYRAAKAGLVAVLPFENLTTHPNAGEVVSRLITTEFYASGFSLLDSREVRRILELDMDDDGRSLSAVELREVGRRLGVDTVVGGSVGEYRYKRDLGEDPVVGFTVRTVDVGSGDIIWAASHSRAEYGIFYHEHHLHENAQYLAELMVEYLLDEAGEPKRVKRQRARTAPAPRTSPAPTNSSAPKASGAANGQTDANGTRQPDRSGPQPRD